MAKLIYGGLTSLDGYVEDAAGAFGWARPDEEVHAFINDLERPVGTYLYGRRMYETMAVWDAPEGFPDPSPAVRDYARIWQAADKIVYSRTLRSVSTRNTRLEGEFDPAMVRELKGRASRDVSLGGATLAAQAIRAGLVDEYYLFLAPIVIGGGKAFLPDDVRVGLELVDERAFANGMVYVRYRATA
jgi:dihydrofolate reductase